MNFNKRKRTRSAKKRKGEAEPEKGKQGSSRSQEFLAGGTRPPSSPTRPSKRGGEKGISANSPKRGIETCRLKNGVKK